MIYKAEYEELIPYLIIFGIFFGVYVLVTYIMPRVLRFVIPIVAGILPYLLIVLLRVFSDEILPVFYEKVVLYNILLFSVLTLLIINNVKVARRFRNRRGRWESERYYGFTTLLFMWVVIISFLHFAFVSLVFYSDEVRFTVSGGDLYEVGIYFDVYYVANINALLLLLIHVTIKKADPRFYSKLRRGAAGYVRDFFRGIGELIRYVKNHNPIKQRRVGVKAKTEVIKELDSKIDELIDQKSRNLTESSILKKNVQSALTELTRVQQLKQNAESELKKILNDKDSLQKDVLAMNQKKTELERTLTAIQREISGLQEKMDGHFETSTITLEFAEQLFEVKSFHGSRWGSDGKISRDYTHFLKKKYNSLIGSHHPDRVANMGEKIKKVAEGETKKINIAYELLRKQ